MEDIDETNYVEYQTMPSGKWHPAGFAESTTKTLLETGFKRYLDDVDKASRDCAAAVRRLVNKGPPQWLEDKHGFPLPDGDTHVSAVWYMSSGTEVPAKLEGSLEGEAREKLWSSQKEVLAQMEAAEGGKDDASQSEKEMAAMSVSDAK
eukprot:Tamp_21666.p2 GENE.Tamp_21666~~Tamp_21666.p2  ORF type:complete len:162 (+),score=45.28 Tamp_21666:40-486(+)